MKSLKAKWPAAFSAFPVLCSPEESLSCSPVTPCLYPIPRPQLLTTSGLHRAPVELPVLDILCSGMLQNVESLVFDLSHILVLRFIYIVTK